MLYFTHEKAASVSNTSDVLCEMVRLFQLFFFPGQPCSKHQQKILH